MTTKIKDWSTTAASNNASPPNGAPEGMPPSGVNDTIRQNMAEVRSWYENSDWIDFGHTPVFFDTTNFRIVSDVTAIYEVNRRIRIVGTGAMGTIYGTITAAVYSSPNTTITVLPDSGTIDSTIDEIAVGTEIATKVVSSQSIKYLDASIPTSALAGATVPTGLVSAYALLTEPSGWLFVSGKTIGNASSGGTARANADTQTLFEGLWNSYSNTDLPIQDSSGVASTRGASASADYAANKRLPLLDARGRVLAAIDNLGGTAANILQRSTTINTTNASTSATVASAVGIYTGMYVVSTNVPVGTYITDISGTTITLSAAATATASGTSARFSIVGDAQTAGKKGGSDGHQLSRQQLPTISGGWANAGLDISSPFGTGFSITSNAASGGGGGGSTKKNLNLDFGADGYHNNVQPTLVLPFIIKL